MIYKQVDELVKKSGQTALKYFNKNEISYKENGTIVTNADIEIEEYLRENLKTKFPRIAFLGEESGLTGNSESKFISDPIDGTSSYSKGFPVWGVCLGLYMNQKIEKGWFYMPVLDEFYYSSLEEGVFLNRRKIDKIVDRGIDNESVLLTSSNGTKIFDINFEGKIRSFGCTAANVLYVALNRAIGAISGRVHIWDIAAVMPAFEYFGGKMAYIDGSEISIKKVVKNQRLEKKVIFASNEKNLEYLLKNIKEKK